LSNDFLLDGKSIGHSYWSLSEHVQNQGIVDALFLSTAKITAFKGKRSGKSALTWITIPNTNANYPIAAIAGSFLIFATAVFCLKKLRLSLTNDCEYLRNCHCFVHAYFHDASP
jgi:hypothetical protein